MMGGGIAKGRALMSGREVVVGATEAYISIGRRIRHFLAFRAFCRYHIYILNHLCTPQSLHLDVVTQCSARSVHVVATASRLHPAKALVSSRQSDCILPKFSTRFIL